MGFHIDDWAQKNKPSDNMIYKDSFWSWIRFISYTFLDMFFKEYTKDIDDWDKIEEIVNKHHEVIGSHTSKSILLPVLKIDYKGVIFVLRYNFYNTEVTVFSDNEIDITRYSDVFESQENTSFYHEGIPKKYCVDVPYIKSHRKFTFRVSCLYDFYAIMLIIQHEIDNE